jgi:hypothetical protein
MSGGMLSAAFEEWGIVQFEEHVRRQVHRGELDERHHSLALRAAI